MKNKFYFYLFSFILMFSLASVERVSACSCVPSTPCESYGRADVVFAGKVVGSKEQITIEDNSSYFENANTSTPTKPEKITYDVGEIYFEVTEYFLSTEKNSRISIRSGKGGGDCSFWFKRGETYLVYAHKGTFYSTAADDKSEKLETSICSRTNLLANAKEDLEFLRSLSAENSDATVFGTLSEILNYRKDDEAKPFSNVSVKFQLIGSNDKPFETKTDVKGNYEIKIPAGKYKIVPALPNYAQVREVESDKLEAELKPFACVRADFTIENKSRISGKFISNKGNPVNDLTIELIPFGSKEWSASADSNKDGVFSLEGIPAGKYVLAINQNMSPHKGSPYPTFFYPKSSSASKAMVLDVKLGQNISNLVFQLPPTLKEQEIRGTVVWADGKPAADTRVEIEDVVESSFFREERIIKTDASGKFVLKGYIGRNYILKAKFEKYDNLSEEEARLEMRQTGKISTIVSANSPPRYVRIVRAEAKIQPFKLSGKPINYRIVLSEE